MEIPINNVLRKMEQELQQALLLKDESKIREHLLIIQTLCSLILEQQIKDEASPMTSIKPKESKPNLEKEDANGDSLFDF